MRVKWAEKPDARGSDATVTGGWLETWQSEDGSWTAEYLSVNGNMNTMHYRLASERTAKREAVRMWRALRGAR